jgi:quercetin dioxygenase-like cupin family protein
VNAHLLLRRSSFSLAAPLAALIGLGAIACRPAPAAAPAALVATPSAGPTASLMVPPWTNEGADREVEVLFEEDGLKISAIALRRGTLLPVHAVDTTISIQVVRGAGELTAAGSTLSVEEGSIVILGPEVPHAMTPASDELVVLLVHYLGTRTSQ